MNRRTPPPRLAALTLTLTLAVGLAGCDSYKAAHNPQLSGIELDGKTMPEVASVQVPMPPAKPKPIPERGEAASLWQRGSRGFFGDQRATKVGDILTVDIDIADQAKLSNASKRARGGSQNMGFPTFFGLGKQLHQALPKTDPSKPIVDLGSSSSASGSGSIDRNETINLKVAAMVIKQLPNGDMVIAGRQEVRVNHELRELRVAGLIRPQDISMNNTVPYEKIAEARISYGGRGQLSAVQQPRYGQDFLNVVLPY